MLHFITDAPGYVVRSIMALVHGWAEDVPGLEAELARDGLATGDVFPRWAEFVIHVRDEEAMSVIHALKDYRVEARKPARQAIGDPTFALAAAAIERETGGSAPAQAYA